MLQRSFLVTLVLAGLQGTLQKDIPGHQLSTDTIAPQPGTLNYQWAKEISGLLSNMTKLLSEKNEVCSESFEVPTNAVSNWNPSAIYVPGNPVTVTCERDHRTRTGHSRQTITCLHGNQWSLVHPCKPICSRPSFENADSDWYPEEMYFSEDIVTVKCHEGYKTEDYTTSYNASCIRRGLWSSRKTCLTTVCKKPLGEFENAYSDWTSNASYFYGDLVTVTCKSGFVTVSENREQTVECLLGNAWANFEQCSIASCDSNIASFVNQESNFDPNGVYLVNDELSITCDKGFTTEMGQTNQDVTCLLENKWSTYEPCSKDVACPPPFVRFNSICFYYNSDMSWYDAKTHCASMEPELGSTLAVFKTSKEQKDFIEHDRYKYGGNIYGKYWIGAHIGYAEDDPQWLDSSHLKLSYFQVKLNPRTSNSYGNENCLFQYMIEIKAMECNKNLLSICTIPLH